MEIKSAAEREIDKRGLVRFHMAVLPGSVPATPVQGSRRGKFRYVRLACRLLATDRDAGPRGSANISFERCAPRSAVTHRSGIPGSRRCREMLLSATHARRVCMRSFDGDRADLAWDL